MNDLHSHLMYGVDDGAKSLSESIAILKEYEKLGVKSMVLTPHFISGSKYCVSYDKKVRLIDELSKYTDIKLYLGNEVYLDSDILDIYSSGKISTINNSRYILIEFPLFSKVNNYYEVVSELVDNGLIPVIAHPERYHNYTLEEFKDLIHLGCIFQGNISSLYGKYGKDSKHNLELLLKKKMIYVLGSDTHRHCIDLIKAKDILCKIVDKEYYIELIYSNFEKIVNNKDIDRYNIKRARRLFKEMIK